MITTRILFVILLIISFNNISNAQVERWQQSVKYKMDVDFLIKKHHANGNQTIEYTNNSPDTLTKIFYHLYLNAFQPESMMDVRSRTLPDPDSRVVDRISKLIKAEQGYQIIHFLKMNGKPAKYKSVGTILEVELPEPILPHSTVKLEMAFTAQVPLQIRRTGRFNSEGIEYSMAQWYPKLCNYDYQGWHADPYIAREFYGIWGDYDVKITLPSDYVVAATGVLQNKDEMGYGYSDKEPKERPAKQTWHFKAENVHDFVWAADPDYKQIVYKAHDGTILRFFFQPGEKTTANWEKLPAIIDESFRFINEKYGKYPFPEYSVIQGGDGGMEYPMATLITGERSMISLVGVTIHELMHSWYQMVLGTNESLYHWMDEGFTSYASSEVMNHLKLKKLIPGEYEKNPHSQVVRGYINFALSGKEEALITHADHFQTNTAYGVASYTKGETFLEQLRYIIDEKAFDKGMLNYFDTWKFKHPNPNDFIRIMEKASGLELDWFKEYFVNSTQTIDYAIDDARGKAIYLKRIGNMPMPLDITITTNKREVIKYYIPLEMMRGEKEGDRFYDGFTVLKDWPWTHPNYKINLDMAAKDILKIEIDASQRLADTDRSNNVYPKVLSGEVNDK